MLRGTLGVLTEGGHAGTDAGGGRRGLAGRKWSIGVIGVCGRGVVDAG